MKKDQRLFLPVNGASGGHCLKHKKICNIQKVDIKQVKSSK